MKPKPNVKNLLRAAIRHYDRMIENPDGKEEPFMKHCPLCKRFRPSCSGCPVSEANGFTGCSYTPYEDVSGAFYEYCSAKLMADTKAFVASYRRSYIAALKKERKFLQRLLLEKGKR